LGLGHRIKTGITCIYQGPFFSFFCSESTFNSGRQLVAEEEIKNVKKEGKKSLKLFFLLQDIRIYVTVSV